MANVNYAELTLAANTVGLLKAKTDLAAVTAAGAKTEAGIKKSMAGVEGAVKSVPMAAKEAAAGMKDLRLSLDPLYASSKQYEAAQKQVTAAVKLGATTQAEANRIMQLAEAKYLGVGNAAQMAAKQMGGNGGFAHQSRMAAMQLSQVAQQTAATGDFVRALAIQLPDLALGFGALGIGIGVVAGALLPMAADLITGRDNAKGLENAMDSLSQASYDYTSAADQAKMSVSELALEFGSAAEEAKRAFEFMQGVNLGKALDQLTVALGTMDFSELERLATIVKEGPAELEVLSDTYNKALAGLQEQFGVTGEQALKLRDHLNEIRTAKGPEEIVQTVDRLNQYLVSAFGSAQDIPPELREMVQRLLEAQTAAARITARLDGSADSANTATNAASNLSGQLSVAAQYAAQLAANLAMAPAGIQGFQNKAEQLTAQIAALDAGLGQITASAAGYRKELEQKYGLADAANEAERAYISGVINRQVKEYTNVQNLNEEYRNKVTALNKVETASKKAGGAAAKAMKAAAREAERFAKEVERLEFDADPLRKYNEELERLEYLVSDHGLSNGAFQKAVEDLNDELANSNPTIAKIGDAISDFVASGMRDFGDLLGAFKNMLKQMIATAIANPIKLSLMGVGGGMAGTAAQAAGAAPGGGGMMGNLMGLGGGGGMFGSLLGAWGGGSGILGGASAALGAFTSGGIGGGLSAVGAMAGQATAGLAGLGTAIGAIALPVAAVAAVFSFFSSKTKILDKGLRITADATSTLVEEFKKVEKSRFWGLSKKKKTYYDELAEEDAAPLEKVIHDLQTGILTTAEALSVGAGAFEAFSYQMKISTKDMSEEEAQAAIIEALQGLSDEFAGMVPGIAELQREGEGASDALTRLSTHLSAVNMVMDTLSQTMFEASLAGADMASGLIEYFGGLDAFNSATTAYFQGFYTEQERFDTAVRQIEERFSELNVSMPQTRAQFREMIEGLDLTTEYGRQMYASLMSMSGALSAVLPAIENFSIAVGAMVGSITTEIDGLIGTASEAMQANEQAASMWYRTAATLREFIADMRGTAGALVSSRDALAFSEARFQTLLASAVAGDNEAATDLTAAARTLLTNTKATARTAAEQARAEARVLADLQLVSGVSDVEGARHDVVSGLLGQQVELLNSVRDAINSGNTLEPEDIDGLNAQLGSLQSAIAAAEMINYQFLKERLSVTVDLLATANLPSDVRRLIANTQNGIEGTIDFIVRTDLAPDQKWLALTGSSEHIKTVEFIVDNSQWSQAAQGVALGTAGTYMQTVRFLAQNTMSADLTGLALSEADTLLKSIKFTAQALPADVRAIVFNQIAPLQKRINFMLGDTIPDDMQSLALDDADAFKRTIDLVAGNILPANLQTLALSSPTGFARTLNILAGRTVSSTVADLALDAATSFTRVINLQTGRTVNSTTARLALDTIGALNRTINLTAGAKLDDSTRRIALAGSSELSRTVNVTLGSQVDEGAKRLALGNLGVYNVAVQSALSPSVSNEVRKIVFGDTGSYTASIQAALSASMPDWARRVLLTQQGNFAVNVSAVLHSGTPAAMQSLLLDANTTAMRAVTILAAYGSSLTAEQRELLAMQTSAITKSIAGNVYFRDMSADDWKLFSMRNEAYQKNISGVLWFRDMTPDKWSLFRMRSEAVGKTVEGDVGFRHMTADDWKLFQMQSEAVTKSLTGLVGFAGMTPDKWKLFGMRNEAYQKNIVGNVYFRDMSANDWNLLRMGNVSNTKTIIGQVDTSKLSTQQLGLLSAINGSTSGNVTLGGTFSFDPTTGFSKWFSTTTRSNITSPMDALRTGMASLRGSLGELAETIRAEIRDREAERERETRIGAITAQAINSTWAGDSVGRSARVVSQIEQLERDTGVSLRQGNGDALLSIGADGRISYDASHVEYGRGANIDAFRRAFWADGGLEDQIFSANQNITNNQRWLQGLRRQVVELGGIPTFANGGFHSGGLRVVGERGPELEMTGPSRIHNANDTRKILGNDNSEVVRELQQLRAELADLKRQSGTFDAEKTRYARKTYELQERQELRAEDV